MTLTLVAALAVLLGALEWLRRGLDVPADVTRKLFHMSVGLMALAAALWSEDGVHAAMLAKQGRKLSHAVQPAT